MGKHFATLANLVSDADLAARSVQVVHEPGAYAGLIGRLLQNPSAVAVIGSGLGPNTVNVCEGIAAELGVSGRRVVVVRVERLLRMNPPPVPAAADFKPDSAQNIWIWPDPQSQQIEFFKTRKPAAAGQWLDSLRRRFDSVLLDCTGMEVTSAVSNIAALADTAVLVVEAGRTSRQTIHLDQRALQLAGAELAGCVLIHQR